MDDYKKYSLEQLDNWIHDAISCSEASPQEIYDVIRKAVEEEYYYHKHHTSQAYELLALLNGNGKGHITFNIDPAGNQIDFLSVGAGNTGYSYTSCDVGDMSDYCNNSWNSFWEDDVIKEDKVVKWQLPVEKDLGSDDYYVNFPDDLLEAADLKEGDQVEWVDNGNGTFILRKPNAV